MPSNIFNPELSKAVHKCDSCDFKERKNNMYIYDVMGLRNKSNGVLDLLMMSDVV